MMARKKIGTSGAGRIGKLIDDKIHFTPTKPKSFNVDATPSGRGGTTSTPSGGARAPGRDGRATGFGSGRPPHTAQVTQTRGGEVVDRRTVRSGGMTPQERDLGFPRSSLATHTESRAVRQADLRSGDHLQIDGQYAPCPSCKGAMNGAVNETGASVTYTWSNDGGPREAWHANGGRRR